jgi:TRAP-type C4-dicarboxylate transport system permease small subunit
MKKLLAWIDRGVEYLVAAIFAVMVVIGLMQVFHRFALNTSLSWSEEAQIFGHVYIVFLGIPIAYRRGAHMYVDTFRDKYRGRVASAFDLLVELIWAAFAVSLMVLGYQVSRVAALQESPGLEIPMSYPYYGMVFGGAYLGLVAAQRIADWIARPAGKASSPPAAGTPL